VTRQFRARRPHSRGYRAKPFELHERREEQATKGVQVFKPSDGLEPSTPSLPSRSGAGSAGKSRSPRARKSRKPKGRRRWQTAWLSQTRSVQGMWREGPYHRSHGLADLLDSRKGVTASGRACPRLCSLHVPSVREVAASRPSGDPQSAGWAERAPMDRNHSITFSR
jgi:hypothetical protein